MKGTAFAILAMFSIKMSIMIETNPSPQGASRPPRVQSNCKIRAGMHNRTCSHLRIALCYHRPPDFLSGDLHCTTIVKKSQIQIHLNISFVQTPVVFEAITGGYDAGGGKSMQQLSKPFLLQKSKFFWWTQWKFKLWQWTTLYCWNFKLMLSLYPDC